MLARAVEKYIRVSPRKVRYLLGTLRQRTVSEALGFLAAGDRRACKPLAKAIASAYANARQSDPMLAEDQVVISRVIADGGPVWKRFRPAAFGRAVGIRKPTTHITVELDRRVRSAVVTPPAPKLKAKPAPRPAQAPAAGPKRTIRKPRVVTKKATVSAGKKK